MKNNIYTACILTACISLTFATPIYALASGSGMSTLTDATKSGVTTETKSTTVGPRGTGGVGTQTATKDTTGATAQEQTVRPTYQPLTYIPGVTDGKSINLLSYINALLTLTITLAAIFAVVQISLIGFTYISQDSGPVKRAEAKKQLFAVLIGVLIISSAYIILKAINPNLVSLRIFGELSESLKQKGDDAYQQSLNRVSLGSFCVEKSFTENIADGHWGFWDVSGVGQLKDIYDRMSEGDKSSEMKEKYKADCENKGGATTLELNKSFSCANTDQSIFSIYCQF